MNLQPLNGFCVVKLSKPEEVTKAGIIIPDTASKEKPQQGEVIAVADKNISPQGVELPVEVKKGDTVIVPKYAGEDITLEGDDYKILELTSVRAIVK